MQSKTHVCTPLGKEDELYISTNIPSDFPNQTMSPNDFFEVLSKIRSVKEARVYQPRCHFSDKELVDAYIKELDRYEDNFLFPGFKEYVESHPEHVKCELLYFPAFLMSGEVCGFDVCVITDDKEVTGYTAYDEGSHVRLEANTRIVHNKNFYSFPNVYLSSGEFFYWGNYKEFADIKKRKVADISYQVNSDIRIAASKRFIQRQLDCALNGTRKKLETEAMGYSHLSGDFYFSKSYKTKATLVFIPFYQITVSLYSHQLTVLCSDDLSFIQKDIPFTKQAEKDRKAFFFFRKKDQDSLPPFTIIPSIALVYVGIGIFIEKQYHLLPLPIALVVFLILHVLVYSSLEESTKNLLSPSVFCLKEGEYTSKRNNIYKKINSWVVFSLTCIILSVIMLIVSIVAST